MATLTNWIYKGKKIKAIEDIPECCPFIVYKIIFDDNTFYIGSKQVYSTTNKKISKKRANELYSGKGRKPTREKKVQESDWKIYQSSSTLVKERLNNGDKAKFQILNFFETKREMLLTEAQLIIHFALKSDEKLLNSWVTLKTSLR